MRTASSSRGSRGGAALAAAALLALATGCAPGPGEPAGGAPDTTSRSVEDTSITAEPGERFTLTVRQNASTREYWYLADPRPDRAVLVSRGTELAPETGEPSAGGGVPLTFTFEATGRGTTRFTLLHCTSTTCEGNNSTLPPDETRPSAAPAEGEASPSPQAPERITYTVTVG
ncbi:protease inhibitor I42 family protein [Streptomyces sp. C10-9-1]|uniref:protease inhibitor I42 family protein n=1 Tax=Streptomyces sp. C10-9-1 TaxID=1859285 RepID=UPI0021125D1C|nr:protease inhibitor I42 family protein [Streptomyces sp. C10-9-1]MCQ6555767.1 protease inhibitor I42 family protein [Streptomyces sp. C10-9-1]